MQILLVRHARSSHPDGVDDHERPLSNRGASDAIAVGEHLASVGVVPPRIVTSTAIRALETARLIAAAFPSPLPIAPAPLLYRAGVADLLRTISNDQRDLAMIVAHQPTLSTTLRALCGAEVAMVPAAVACVQVPDAGPVREGVGVLLWMLVPRLARGEGS